MNVASSKETTRLARCAVARLEHPAHTLLPISSAFWMKAPSRKNKQPTNAYPPMQTDGGGDTVKLTRDLHDVNELVPSVANFSGIIMADRLMHPEKA